MQIKWVILLFVVACPVAAKPQPQPQLRWGGFELIGATPSQRQWVSSQLLLDEQGAIEPQLFKQGPTFCAALRQRFSREIRCEMVGYQDLLYFVVNFLPDTQAVYQDLRKIAKVAMSTKVPMSAKVPRSATADLPCPGVCAQATERLAAWRYLASKVKQNQVAVSTGCATAADLLYDEDPAIRNDAGQFINMQLNQCLQVLDAELLATRLRQLLYRPYHSDRNKSIATLGRLLPYLKPDSIRLVRHDANWLATQSILPNVGGLAKSVATERD